MINVRKAAIIGCGFVGSSIAFSLMQRGLYSELVLIDANQAKAEGEAMDLSHGLPYAASMQIYAGTYDDVADCAMVILTAGANQKPGETRLDLIDKNVAILKSIIPELTKRLFQGILLVVSNPVDVLTYAAWKLSGLPAKHVIGSGTVLDTARLKYLLGQYLQVDSRNVHAAVIGEHGDSELAVWSSANISSLDLDHFCQLRGKKNYRAELDRIYHEVRDSAYEIIERKGATYYGIAMAVGRIAEMIREMDLKPGEMKLIVNRAPNGELNPGVMEEINKYGLQLAGVLPQDETVYEYDCEGKPSSQVPDKTPVKTALAAVMRDLNL